MALILIALMAVTTMTLRFLPFLIFGENTPRYITYLGKVLPQATIGFFHICVAVDDIQDAWKRIVNFMLLQADVWKKRKTKHLLEIA